ncbi:MAG TPA: hypothetical protein VFV46_08450 [Lacibacter sp.]|nr:hypothetical protein [Lacibacter sp.]
MQPNFSKMGGFLKSSFFGTLIFFNFIISLCFIVMIAVQHMGPETVPDTMSVKQNPLQERVSEETAQLMKLQE